MMTAPKTQRLVHALAIAVLLSIAACTVVAARAEAATYHTFLCRIPYGPNAGAPARADNLTFFARGFRTFASTQNCLANGGLMYATMDGSVSHQPGDVAGVTFTAPTGTAISGFRVSRSILVGPGGSPAQAQADLIYSGLLAEPSCTSATCKSRGDGNATFSPANLVEKQGLTNVSTLTWQVGCYGNLPCPTVTSPMIYSAAYFVSMADILLDDPSAPATATASGALATGGRLSGPQSATFTGTDTGSGVFKGLLVIDGATVAQQSAAAAGSLCTDLAVAPDARPSFLTAVPCPPQGQGTLTFDTSTLARGTHTAQVIVSDAAGNRRVASTSTITIKGGGHG